ncbi:2-C-methyl-D-erythritol 2,4-cyclodiphosphate synthase [Desulfurobacterium pacificum]|uniref:2-C-methyl-D-erythritol 2,4-cyclodiphosphate synthase n=1 Tax=Desulfurobacterium pacificum TaxID=240166 RepID=A0ABY1NCB2_9BACT|nr:2-C-methyl-D-erythritol 2,4-cyclodiphosphate synthase [Desulfurobacterium pacificum]SMP05474.1 2-C-methyl-D-erythritol 2,4-cyclodiphosphate synthase [Desulfurobacterium pacificum]
MYRVGIGYDAHRFEEGRKLIIGGVEIPYHLGLKGHSDADVLTHAICDAILGALSLGDIGELFPDTDEKYRSVSSLILLEKVVSLAERMGYKIVNVDTVIVAQEPKFKPYKEEMKRKLASVMKIGKERISVKATTTEGMGFEGRREGISAQAVVLLEKTSGRFE